MTRDYKKQYEWNKENKVFIGLSLSKKADEDIIDYLDSKRGEGESKQGVVKKCIRLAMDLEEADEERKRIEEIEARLGE